MHLAFSDSISRYFVIHFFRFSKLQFCNHLKSFYFVSTIIYDFASKVEVFTKADLVRRQAPRKQEGRVKQQVLQSAYCFSEQFFERTFN